MIDGFAAHATTEEILYFLKCIGRIKLNKALAAWQEEVYQEERDRVLSDTKSRIARRGMAQGS